MLLGSVESAGETLLLLDHPGVKEKPAPGALRGAGQERLKWLSGHVAGRGCLRKGAAEPPVGRSDGGGSCELQEVASGEGMAAHKLLLDLAEVEVGGA